MRKKPLESGVRGHFILKATLQNERPYSAGRVRFHGKARECPGSKLASVLIEKRLCNVIAKADLRFGQVQARAAMLAPSPMVRDAHGRPRGHHRDADMTHLVDGTLEDSFPASDPPSWTASIVRPAPAAAALS